jgi:hypothetical protein
MKGESARDFIRSEIERVKKLVRFDIPDLSEEVKNFLISQQLQFVNIQYARFMAGVKFTEQDVKELLEGAIDCHAHGAPTPLTDSSSKTRSPLTTAAPR